MKTMTCEVMGGPCDASMTAGTEAEMVQMGWDHVAAAHPEMLEKMNAMTQEEKDAWAADFHAKWEAAPEDAAEEALPAGEETPEAEASAA